MSFQLPPNAIPFGSGFMLDGRYYRTASDYYQKTQQQEQSSGGSLLSNIASLASKAANASGLAPVYHAAAAPSRAIGKAVRETVPGAPGRILAAGAETATDPLTLAGLALAVPSGGSSLAPAAERVGLGVLAKELLGRGSLTVPRYLASTALAGAASEGAKEAGGGTIAQIGAGALGGYAGLANLPSAWRRQAARTIATAEERSASRIAAISPTLADKLKTQAALTRPIDTITQAALERTINDREGRVLIVKDMMGKGLQPKTPSQAEDWKAVLDPLYQDNTDALKSLSRFMSDIGRTEIPITTDIYDLGRHASLLYKAQSQYDEWGVAAAQAAKRLEAVKAAAEALPNYRFSPSGTPTAIGPLLRDQMLTEAPDVLPAQQALLDARNTLAQTKTAFDDAQAQVKAAMDVEKQGYKALISQAPAGSRATIRDYISALVKGDQPRIDQLVTRLGRRKVDLSTFDFDSAMALHQTSQQAQDLANTLKSQLAEHTTAYESAFATHGKTIQQGYGSAVKKLQKYLFQPEGQDGAFYRIGRIAEKDGQVYATFDKVTPHATPADAIEEGAARAAEQSRSLRDAEARFADTRLRAEEARKAGDTPTWQKLSEEAKAIRAEIDTLKQPARPVPLDQLPHSPNRLVLPLNDVANRFQLFTTTAGTKTVAGETIRDAATVARLNDRARLTIETEQISHQLEAADSTINELLQQAGLASLTTATPEQLASLDPGIAASLLSAQQQKEVLSAQLTSKQNQLDTIESAILQGQQGIEATLADAQQQFDKAVSLRDSALADSATAHEAIISGLSIPNPDSLAAQGIARMQAFNQRIHDSLVEKAGARVMSQAAYQDIQDSISAYTSTIRSNLPKDFKDRFEGLARAIEQWVPRLAARNHLASLLTPFQFSESNLDPFAVRNGIQGWVNRAVLARGLRNPEMEGLASTFLNGRNTASFLASADYGSGYLHARKAATALLSDLAKGTDEKAAWARALSRQSEDAQLRAYIKSVVKPVDDKSWAKLFASIPDEYAFTDTQKQALHAALSDNFSLAAIMPELFNTRSLPGGLRRITEEWGSSFRDLTRLTELETGGTGASIINRLIDPRFRAEFGAKGRLPARPGSTAPELELKRNQRNIVTDLAEVMRRLEHAPGSPDLTSILLPAEQMVETLPAQLMLRMVDHETFRTAAKYLKNPDDWKLLARGESLPATAWKSADHHADWESITSIMKQQEGRGPWSLLNDAAQGVNKLVASTLAADLSFTTVQLGSMMLTNPIAAARVIGRMIHGATTDQGFAAYIAEPQNYETLRKAVERGLGLGFQSVTGGEQSGNLWELLPITRPIGKGINKLNKLTFDRAQTILKMEAIKANLGTIQALKSVGRETGSAFVDGMPALNAVHKQADIWNSTNEEVFDAVIRLVNNQFGGLPRSQRANEAWREWSERMLLMVPGFFRARAGLVNQAARVLGDPTALTAQGVEGWLAASILSREMGMAAMLSGAAAIGLGMESDWWDNVKAGPGVGTRWLSIPLGNGSYLPTLPTTGAYSLYSNLILGSRKLQDANLDPATRANAIIDFFNGRQNPVVSTMVEELKGKDFWGRRLDSPRDRVAHVAQAVLPLWVSQTVVEGNEALREGNIDPLSMAAETGAEFFGRNYRPPLPSQQLNNAFKTWQMENIPGQPPVDWRDAPSDLRRTARENNPNIAKLENAFIQQQARTATDTQVKRNQLWDAYQAKMDDLTEQQSMATAKVLQGQMTLEEWRQAYANINDDRANASDDLTTYMSSLGLDLSASETRRIESLFGAKIPSQVALALMEYRSIRPADFSRPNAQRTAAGSLADEDIDWGAFSRARQEALQRYSPEVQAQVRSFLEPNDPIAQRLLAARTALDQYWTQIPKYRGLDATQSRQVDAYIGQLRNYETVIRSQLPANVKVDYKAIWQKGLQDLMQRGYIKDNAQLQLAMLAYKYGTSNAKTQLQARDPRSMVWLLDHPDIVRFYPWVGGELPGNVKKLLPPDTRPQLELQQIQDQRLHGTQPG